jgi:hypothetical protein
MAQSAEPFEADVVVAVDTSVSMSQPGMDPERASLLVTKLLSDIVPGKLAVVRLLDLVRDEKLVPGSKTGKFGRCEDDPSRNDCEVIMIGPEVMRDIRARRVATEIRPQRGSAEFKTRLESHLRQESNNSIFQLAFAAALGVFDENKKAQPDLGRHVIWLSDGEVPPNNLQASQALVREMKNEGVDVRAIVFGRGKTDFAKAEGLPVFQSSGPAQLVEAFTDAFRVIVEAPYKIHSLVSRSPSFQMKQRIDESWVIVYGDATLADASVETPSGTVRADFASDSWKTAGAYKVAHFTKPAAGNYTVKVSGGGPQVSYGVVQRSNLGPHYLGPPEITSGIQTTIVAGLRSDASGPDVTEAELGEPVEVTAQLPTGTVKLHDDGQNGDEKAGDGRYSGYATLQDPGDVRIALHAKSSFLDKTSIATVRVSGFFRCPGCETTLDFGSLKAGSRVCRDLPAQGEQQGLVPFEVQPERPMPGDHKLVLARTPLAPNETKSVCLETTRDAESSRANGEPWARLRVRGNSNPEAGVLLRMRWEVRALTFWERWGWLILLILGLLILAVIIYGYIWPNRFARELAVAFAPEYADLDDQTPQPLKQWRDIGIGFYRHARAFFHADFRVNAKSKGAVAMLEAGRNRAALAKPANGNSLYRETSDGDWELVAVLGKRANNGDVFRVGDHGPYIRIAARLMR